MKLSLITLVLISATGCATAVMPEDTSAPTSTDAGPNKTPVKDGGAPQKDSAASTPGDDAATSDPDSGVPVDCNSENTKATCQQCCVNSHKPGYGVYQKTLLNCACQAPGACVNECGTEFCAQKPTTPNGACETCLNTALQPNSGACYNDISNACTNDSDCLDLFQTCIPQCTNKP